MSAFRATGIPLAATLILLATVGNVRAQEIEILGAAGRFEQKLDTLDRIPRLSATESRHFNARLEALLDMLRANPTVNTPPADLCTRVVAFTARDALAMTPDARHMAVATLGVSIPISFDGQRCHPVTGTGMEIRLNSIQALFPDGNRVNNDPEDRMYRMPELTQLAPGIHRTPGGTVVLTRPGVPLYEPVTKEEYLRALEAEWVGGGLDGDDAGHDALEQWIKVERPALIAENEATLREMAGYLSAAELETMRRNLEQMIRDLDATMQQVGRPQAGPTAGATDGGAGGSELADIRAQLAALTPAQRRMPACHIIDDYAVSVGEGACPPGTEIGRPSALLFNQAAHGGEVRAITISAALEGHVATDRAHTELVRAIYGSLDLQAMAALLDDR